MDLRTQKRKFTDDQGETLLSDVFDFNSKFGLDFPLTPRLLTSDEHDFRMKCLNEELAEYRQAVEAEDMEQAFDALIDLVYFAIGTAYFHGFPFYEGWKRVQAANMAKTRANSVDDSKRGSVLDVVKPEGWKPPTLSDLLI